MTPERKAEITSDITLLIHVQDMVYATLRRSRAPAELIHLAGIVASFRNAVEVGLAQDIDYFDNASHIAVPPLVAEYIGEKFARMFGRLVLYNRAKNAAESHVAFLHGAGLCDLPHVRDAIFDLEGTLRNAMDEKKDEPRRRYFMTALLQLDELRRAFAPVAPTKPDVDPPEFAPATP